MVTYKPRNDFVVIKISKVDTLRGIAVPENSIEGMEFSIVAFGPKVEGLKSGDKVMILGKLGDDYGFIPGSRQLIVTKESNVALVVEETSNELNFGGEYGGEG